MIQLGDLARDTITGFQGTVVAETKWLHGCRRLTLQPTVGADGKMPDQATFDEPQLALIPRARHQGSAETGGPRPEPRRR